MNSSVVVPSTGCDVDNTTGSNTTNCTKYTGFWENSFTSEDMSSPANMFFTYFTPIVFTIGIIGNTLSLIVFMSKNMRKLSASMYLAALSISDLMALMFYVLPEWLKYGMSTYEVFFRYNGVCQLTLYLQYIARFLSSWILVFFTIERFIGVCFPLRRRKDICDSKSTLRVLLGSALAAALGCLFKPILSGVIISRNGTPVCTTMKEHSYLSFILDSIFGVTITFIPFILITGLNLLIIRTLILRNRFQRKIRLITEESVIRLEFTFILLAISICFVSLNLPYFAVWCKHYWTIRTFSPPTTTTTHEVATNLGEILHVTRTIFYTNYCINFFLYSVTGAYFRKELKLLFVNRGTQRKYSNYNCTSTAPMTQHYSRSNSHTTPQSWV